MLPYDHPLGEESIVEVDGEEIETLNSWAFADIIVRAWQNGNKNAVSMVSDCLAHSGIPDLDIPSILAERSLSEARARTIVNWVEAGITRKLEEAFAK
jgi:hypothetical protein